MLLMKVVGMLCIWCRDPACRVVKWLWLDNGSRLDREKRFGGWISGAIPCSVRIIISLAATTTLNGLTVYVH